MTTISDVLANLAKTADADRAANLTEDEKQSLVKSAIETNKSRVELSSGTIGKPTGLQCSCGGVLHELIPDPRPPLLKDPPRSKNRRIRKKQEKRWREENRWMFFLHGAMNAIKRGGYICGSCGQHAGFYDAIARNCFKVEPMPMQSALTYIYDQDIK